ncbi:heme-binding domain-containing protein [Anaerolinea sp.]|uniref:heme-binding domain-containing protein n=1 Tax=Anaerolinea sp. TaxID=1872519 RepID=UPI002ACDF57C|nr:heme-binding domain-containing protein [Anaerolinea sp.]
MKHKVFLFGSLFILIVFGVLQVIPVEFVQKNPSVIAEPVWDTPQTRELFMRACGDCHSNETAWPWYSRIAPASWLIARDVREGREKLNVSEWGTQKNEADEIREVIENGSMPPWFYLPMHPEARLSAQEKQALILGLENSFGVGEDGTGKTGEENEHKTEDDD